MDEINTEAGIELRDKRKPALDWRFIRKVEALVFASMFLAVPFFAFRIVDIAGTSLMVQNTAVDLIKDLIRAREIAKDYGLSITVSSAPPSGNDPCSYLIQNGTRTIEQVVLPRGVSMYGSVTFDDKGFPRNRASFIVSRGAKTSYVEVDGQGQTSLH
jgi:hypothetical protein